MIGMVRAYVNSKVHMQNIAGHRSKGQTMTEYALILATIAIATYLTYQVLGQDVSATVTSISSAMNGP